VVREELLVGDGGGVRSQSTGKKKCDEMNGLFHDL
jgi:hypothetical protein